MNKIREKLDEPQTWLYIQSMSIFLHEMRTSIYGGIVNGLKSIDGLDGILEKKFKRASINLFALCDLIPVLEAIQLQQSSESIKRQLLKTQFFTTVPCTDSMTEVLREISSETKGDLNGTQISFNFQENDLTLDSLISKDGIFPTRIFYEVLFYHMLNELKPKSRRDNDVHINVRVSPKDLIFEAISRDLETEREISIQDPFTLFNLVLICANLGEIILLKDETVNTIKLVCF